MSEKLRLKVNMAIKQSSVAKANLPVYFKATPPRNNNTIQAKCVSEYALNKISSVPVEKIAARIHKKNMLDSLKAFI